MKKVCCICGKEFTGWGNNPYSIKNEGECCKKCNMEKVVPARLAKLSILEHSCYKKPRSYDRL